jgi:sigma-B regulation protein RsbU (phosphoserine phosphatase)
VTALYGVLDIKTGLFSYARAGHEPPLILNEKGEVHRLPHQSGMALGLWEDIALDEYSLFLPKGSLLVMFTDGMTDCRDPKGVPFGLERVKSTVAEQRFASAQTSCDELLKRLLDYQDGSKQDDDVTLLAIHAK